MSDKPVFLVSAKRCSECLFSKNRVVSAERMADIVAHCDATQTHFQCHKGTLAGVNLNCAGDVERAPYRTVVHRLADIMGIVETVDADDPEAVAAWRERAPIDRTPRPRWDEDEG